MRAENSPEPSVREWFDDYLIRYIHEMERNFFKLGFQSIDFRETVESNINQLPEVKAWELQGLSTISRQMLLLAFISEGSLEGPANYAYQIIDQLGRGKRSTSAEED